MANSNSLTGGKSQQRRFNGLRLQEREPGSSGWMGGGASVKNRTLGLARSGGWPSAGNPGARGFHATVVAPKSLLGRRAIHRHVLAEDENDRQLRGMHSDGHFEPSWGKKLCSYAFYTVARGWISLQAEEEINCDAFWKIAIPSARFMSSNLTGLDSIFFCVNRTRRWWRYTFLRRLSKLLQLKIRFTVILNVSRV